MANPLTLYVPIKQDDGTQFAAQQISDNFPKVVGPGLDAVGIVHFARMALILNPAADPATGKKKINAILLLTEYDGNMTEYLSAFWHAPGGGVKTAFITLATLMLDGPKDPQNFELEDFENFITGNNLNKDSDNYSAYPDTVADILEVAAKN
jgi:hypothetical protein